MPPLVLPSLDALKESVGREIGCSEWFMITQERTMEIRTGVRMAVNYGLNRVRFPAPVLVDSRIRARFTLAALKEISGAVEATFSVSLEVERMEKPCCAAEWVVRYYR